MPEELRRPAAAVQTSSQLAQVVRDEVQKVHAWYRNLQAQQLQRTQALVLEGRPQEALLEMREANVLHSGVMRERCERDAREMREPFPPSLPSRHAPGPGAGPGVCTEVGVLPACAARGRRARLA